MSLGPGFGAQEERGRECAEEGLLILPHTRPSPSSSSSRQGPRGLLGPHSPVSPSSEQEEESGYF